MVKPPPLTPHPVRPQTPPVPGGRLSGADRRAAIVAAAFHVFATRGFAGATTRDIAEAARISEPILYRHFPSKSDLFTAVLDEATNRILARVGTALEPVQGAKRRLEALAAALEPTIAEMEDEFRVLNGAAATHADPATTAAVRDAYGKIGGALTAALKDEGLAKGVRAETAGHLLLEIGLGASLVRPLGVPGVTRVGYGQEALRLVAKALTKGV